MRAILVASVVVLALGAAALGAQQDAVTPTGQPIRPETSPRSETGVPAIEATPGASAPFSAAANPILHVPVSNLHPGGVSFAPRINNPLVHDPQAATRGMKDFIQFNCVGCHAANAGGGMGPALSEGQFIYGSSPANLFLSIYQGRPNGMPAWGEILPESTIWELVAYVQSIAHPPDATFGRTISRTPPSPAVQQTPAEFLQTANPSSFTEAFGAGRAPKGDDPMTRVPQSAALGAAGSPPRRRSRRRARWTTCTRTASWGRTLPI